MVCAKQSLVVMGRHAGRRAFSSQGEPPPLPDPETLREQWRYAVQQYAKAYSNAWGAALMIGTGVFGIAWLIKGENPIGVNSAGQLKKEKKGEGA